MTSMKKIIYNFGPWEPRECFRPQEFSQIEMAIAGIHGVGDWTMRRALGEASLTAEARWVASIDGRDWIVRATLWHGYKTCKIVKSIRSAPPRWWKGSAREDYAVKPQCECSGWLDDTDTMFVESDLDIPMWVKDEVANGRMAAEVRQWTMESIMTVIRATTRLPWCPSCRPGMSGTDEHTTFYGGQRRDVAPDRLGEWVIC